MADDVHEPPVIEQRHVVQWFDYAEPRQFVEDAGNIFGGQPFRTRTVTTTTHGFQTNDSLRVITDFAPGSLRDRLAGGSRNTPEGLLLAAADRPEAVRWVGTAVRSGRQHEVLAFADTPGGLVNLEFDVATGALAAQVAVGTGASLGDQDVRREYSDWRSVRGGLRLPFAMRDVRNGVQFNRTVIESIELDSPIPDSLFVRPNGYGVEAARSGQVVELGSRVYAILNAYNSLVVVFDTYAAVIEPVLSEGATRRTLAVLDSVAPGKPLRYVIATHFHSDHVSGVRGFLARGATLLAPPHAGVTARRIAAAPRQIRPDNVTPAPLGFTPVTEERVLREGAQELRLIPIGPSPHAEQMLIAYLPGSALLYVADVLDLAVPEGAPGMGGHDTRHLLQKLERLRLEVATIVPTHGRIGTLQDARDADARFGRR